jgi:DNA-binding transcriptional LysR family regulator
MAASLRDLELRHLHALVAVASERSFGRAAERLGFTQSAVSQQIAALERVVGEPVFDRPGGPKPVSLTPTGRVLLDHAQAVLDRLRKAEDELDRLRSGSGGRIVVGTFQSVSVKVLPEVISRLRPHAPGVEIRLFEHDDNDVLHERLLTGELDCSFLVLPVRSQGLEIVDLGDDPFVVLSPPELAGAGGAITTAELRSAPLIGEHVSSCQLLVDQGLRSVGVTPEYVFRSNDNGAVQAMARAGMGRAVMPLLAVDADDPRIVIQELDPPIPPRRLGLAMPADRTRPPVLDRFAGLAVEVATELRRHRDQVGRRTGA